MLLHDDNPVDIDGILTTIRGELGSGWADRFRVLFTLVLFATLVAILAVMA